MILCTRWWNLTQTTAQPANTCIRSTHMPLLVTLGSNKIQVCILYDYKIMHAKHDVNLSWLWNNKYVLVVHETIRTTKKNSIHVLVSTNVMNLSSKYELKANTSRRQCQCLVCRRSGDAGSGSWLVTQQDVRSGSGWITTRINWAFLVKLISEKYFIA